MRLSGNLVMLLMEYSSFYNSLAYDDVTNIE